jgi:DNA-binding CsgD family transcriptional regulator
LLGARASARPIEPAHVAPVAAYAVADRAHEFQPEPVPTRQLGIGLTRREHEVALLLARGLSNREVAEQLSISVKTAKNHVQRVLDKAGVHSRSQFVAFALSAAAWRHLGGTPRTGLRCAGADS